MPCRPGGYAGLARSSSKFTNRVVVLRPEPATWPVRLELPRPGRAGISRNRVAFPRGRSGQRRSVRFTSKWTGISSMHGTLRTATKTAISIDGKTSGKSAVDDTDWFSIAARKLYSHKPGTALHLITGLGDERLCQRYASGEVRPPAYFLRALLRGDHGQQWHGAVMDGCAEQWWLDAENARALCAQFQIIKRE